MRYFIWQSTVLQAVAKQKATSSRMRLRGDIASVLSLAANRTMGAREIQSIMDRIDAVRRFVITAVFRELTPRISVAINCSTHFDQGGAMVQQAPGSN